MRKVTLFFVLASLAIGCGPKGDTSSGSGSGGSSGGTKTAVTHQPGMTTIDLVENLGSIDVPKEWLVIKSADPKSEKNLKDLEKKSPAFGMMSGALYKACAIDMRPGHLKGAFAENVNVVVTDGQSGDASKSDLETASKAVVSQIQWKGEPHTEIVDLAAGPAVHYWGTPNMGANNDLDGYLFGLKGKVYTITLSMASGELSKEQKLGKDIANSLSVK